MHKIINHTIACLGLLLAGRAMALDERHTYEVFVDVPALSFYVLPADTALFIHEQRLHWDVIRSDFTPLRTHFTVRNQAGGLQARLGQEAVLQRGFDNQGDIKLKVMLNNIHLSTTPTLIVDSATAQNEARVALNINAIKPAQGYSPGLYMGSVSLIFESAPP